MLFPDVDRVLLERPEKESAEMTDAAMLTARALQNRYGISAMTVWRWEHDERLGFPAPTIIRGRRYWRASDLEAWECNAANQSGGSRQLVGTLLSKVEAS